MTTRAGTAAKADKAAFRWLRTRHPDWNDEQITRLISRSHVIDEHPNWGSPEIDREVTRRLQDTSEETTEGNMTS